MEQIGLALQCEDTDNVATVFSNGVKANTPVRVRNKRGEERVVTVRSDVPYGHKIAVERIEKGQHIVKYGESIGAALLEIPLGEYVHVHNLEALRGRGDR